MEGFGKPKPSIAETGTFAECYLQLILFSTAITPAQMSTLGSGCNHGVCPEKDRVRVVRLCLP